MQRVDALISEKQTITNRSHFPLKKETSGRKKLQICHSNSFKTAKEKLCGKDGE